MNIEKEKNKTELTTEEKIQKYEEFLEKGHNAHFHEYKKIPLLNAEEEIEFCQKAQEGDTKYLEYAMVANIRWVRAIASKYHYGKGTPHSLDEEDLVQEGAMGLRKAILLFKKEKEARFSTYSHFWIHQYVRRAIFDTGYHIRIPVYLQEKINRVRAYMNEFSKQEGIFPTTAEIAQEVNISEKEVDFIQEQMQKGVLSFDRPMQTEESDFLFSNTLKDEETENFENDIVNNLYYGELQSVLSELPNREAYILKQRFGFGTKNPKNLSEIGKELGLTRQRVEQIEKKAMYMFQITLMNKEKDLTESVLQEVSQKEKEIFELIAGAKNGKPITLNKITKKTGFSEKEIQDAEKIIFEKFSQKFMEGFNI